jgi:hypothetical protein
MTVKTIRQTFTRNDSSDATMQTELIGFRDRIRNALDPNDWIVSDIANWLNNGHRTWAFIVRRKNSSHEWLLGFIHRSGQTSSSTSFFPTVLPHGLWRDLNNNSYITTDTIRTVLGAWGFFVHHNEKLDENKTYNFEFVDPINLTYGSDSVTPSANIVDLTFWPESTVAAMYPGFVYNNTGTAATTFLTTTGRGHQAVFNFESSGPSLSIERRTTQALIPTSYVAMGRVHLPSTVSDSDRTGSFGCTFSYDASIYTGFWGRLASSWAHFKDAGGNYVLNGSFTIQGNYNLDNDRDPDGSFKRRSINVQSVAYVKGVLNPDYFFEVGAFENPTRWGLKLQGPQCSMCRTNGSFAGPFEAAVPYPIGLQNGQLPPFS